jgi:hypothetical protein
MIVSAVHGVPDAALQNLLLEFAQSDPEVFAVRFVSGLLQWNHA